MFQIRPVQCKIQISSSVYRSLDIAINQSAGLFNSVQFLPVYKWLVIVERFSFSGLKRECSGTDIVNVRLKSVDFICIKAIIRIGFIFTHLLESEIRPEGKCLLPDLVQISLAIEEWFGFLCFMESIDKKQKNDLMAKVGEILALGRGIGNGIGIFLLVQRADSSNFSAGSREQFQNLLCFGRLSREQRLMLFAGEDLDNTRNYKTGQGITLIDGQEGATEIIVPWIPEQDILLKRIRNYMDKQPSLQELLHQIQSTGGVAEHKP